MRLERDRVERDEAVDELANLACREQQADVGPAVADDGQVTKIGPADRPDQGHWLAPRTPAAYANRHSWPQFGHYVGGRHQLLPHRRLRQEASACLIMWFTIFSDDSSAICAA